MPKNYPLLKGDNGEFLTEIAVVGRSNVGKSSLLNDLFQSKGLVKTSSTPGKTQALNFFLLDNDSLVFVDLPGYGYAKVPESVKRKWGPMIQTYLKERTQLKLILFLFDMRRLPNDEDRQLMDWIALHQHAVILVVTKADKIAEGQRMAHVKKILEGFQTENLHYLIYSVPKKIGRRELTFMIQDALEDV
jgi:GTP-binding protein